LWSGGIDSTAIREHIFADEEESTCIHISFMNKAFNENLAELITFSEQESVIDINFDEWLNGDEISQVIDLMDQPISDPACLPILAAAKWAKQNDFRVIFTGDGADEALRGYRAIQAEKLLKVLVTLVRIIPKWFIKFADENISRISDSGYLSFLSTLQRILNTRFVKREYAMMLLVSPNYCLPRHFPEIAEVNNSYTFSHLENYFQNVILPQIYLHKTDRIFAGLGIEARSPWLTRSFIENSMLLSKRFLKKAGKPLSQLLTQKQVSLIQGKHGLGVPIQDVIARLEKPDWHIPHISARKIDQLWTLASRGSTGVNNLIWSLYLLNRKIQFWKRLSILD
jgi:asparagine synthetase B (glutamine-hydrolysing)